MPEPMDPSTSLQEQEAVKEPADATGGTTTESVSENNSVENTANENNSVENTANENKTDELVASEAKLDDTAIADEPLLPTPTVVNEESTLGNGNGTAEANIEEEATPAPDSGNNNGISPSIGEEDATKAEASEATDNNEEQDASMAEASLENEGDSQEDDAEQPSEGDDKQIPGVVRLFVGNLNEKTKSEDLRPLFEKYGPITQCDVRKSYGFVHMKVDEATGDKIVKELTGQVVQGNAIQVKHSISKGPAKSSVKIFVGNLSEKVMPDDLKNLFSKFGTVYECDIIRNYAFVHMEKGEHVDKAVAELAGHSLHGNAINVQLSTSRVRNKPGMGDTEACYRCGKPGHWSKECPRGNQRSARGKSPKGSKAPAKERPTRGRGRGSAGGSRPAPYPPPHPRDRFPERGYDNYGGDFDYGYPPRPRGFPEERRGFGVGGRGFPPGRPGYMGPGPMRGPYYDGPEGPMDYGYKRPAPQGGRGGGYRSFEDYPPRFDRRPSAARGRYMPY